jgi:hypothetical protein
LSSTALIVVVVVVVGSAFVTLAAVLCLLKNREFVKRYAMSCTSIACV